MLLGGRPYQEGDKNMNKKLSQRENIEKMSIQASTTV